MRLDFKNSEFKEKSEQKKPVRVVRCLCDYEPTNDEYMLVDAAHSYNNPPCTGQGFVGAEKELIPEYTYGRPGQNIKAGAIFEIDEDGNEYLAAVWDKRKGQFKEV